MKDLRGKIALAASLATVFLALVTMWQIWDLKNLKGDLIGKEKDEDDG